MGFLSLRSKPKEAESTSALVRLPSGSWTVDPSGRVVASTLPSSFPDALLKEITTAVLTTFQAAREAQMPLVEIVADYSALKLTARELRGGAIIFLAPRSLGQR
jgi:hypothetical protein